MTAPDLCREETARAVARRFRVVPQHGMGQNFLVDQAARDAIVATLDGEGPSRGQIVEIGSGLGALSQGLLAAGYSVLGIEVDPRCVAALGLLRASHPEFQVMEADVLRVAPGDLNLAPIFRVAANLPYQLTGAVLQRLTEWRPQPAACHLLVQREVARRLAADLGDWSLSTLALRLVAEVEIAFDVGPESFWPRPKVTSSLLITRPRRDAPGGNPSQIMALARPIFQQRRKQLHHGLAGALGIDSREASKVLMAARIDPASRPGALGTDEWVRLASEVSRSSTG
ncbi:MAG: 16S rRNA (adenine(1518)-N(6)/adenine(1519)-N(6))-dimethyltransferase RsmA [Candidatus Dormibacteraeota bacterium]|nr:16S rRNA (adenine(1518)-N(6)/adenine(1519)-N(6))-dimethyltransferase RsmA [Candidatus Dormibacteraeota bacterium]